MTDIRTREDIHHLMKKFYEKAIPDPQIGYFFTDIAKLDLEAHLPVITNFWEMVVFGTRTYNNNVMTIHQHLHRLAPINEIHFARWLTLFSETVDELFAGNHAELIKQRALSIATIMKIKLLHSSPTSSNHDNTGSTATGRQLD